MQCARVLRADGNQDKCLVFKTNLQHFPQEDGVMKFRYNLLKEANEMFPKSKTVNFNQTQIFTYVRIQKYIFPVSIVNSIGFQNHEHSGFISLLFLRYEE